MQSAPGRAHPHEPGDYGNWLAENGPRCARARLAASVRIPAETDVHTRPIADIGFSVQIRLMTRRIPRVLLIALASVIYWTVAAVVILIASYALPGDCGTARNVADLRLCQGQVRVVAVGGFVVAVLAYGCGLWRVVRRD